MLRAKKVPAAPLHSANGLKGWSVLPMGVLLDTAPSGEVGEYWPLVRP